MIRSGRSPSSGSPQPTRASAARASSCCAARASSTSRICPPTRSLSSLPVPCAITRPWSMTAIWSASWSASSRYWVVNRTVVPSRTSSRTTAQIWLRLRGSSPAVGSSRKRMRGSLRRLEARSSRRRIPPEYVRAGRSPASTRSKRSSNSPARCRASARERPNRRPNISRFSRPVRISSTAANCPVRPSNSRTAAGSRATSSPRTSARPESGTSSVARTRTRVVLPAPLGPSRPNTAPSGTTRSTPASATVAPKRLVTPSTRAAGVEDGTLTALETTI